MAADTEPGQSAPGGARLFVERDLDDPLVLPFAGGAAGVFTTRAPERETPSQDAAALIPFDEQRGVLAVADGVGGHAAGGRAAAAALRALRAALKDAAATGRELRDAVLNGFEAANRAVIELGLGAATTLVVAALDADGVRPYHAGDSMILVVGQRGRLKHQTVAHSPVGYAVESGLLDEADALVHEDRHIVSNSIGSVDMHIEVGPVVPLAPRDTLLLASDGLFDNLSLEEIVERVRKGPVGRGLTDLALLARRRMDGAADGQPGKPDDLTVLIWRRAAPRRAPGQNGAPA